MGCSCGWRSHSPFWQYRDISTLRTNCDFIEISKVRISYHWEIILISNKRCLPWNDYRKKLEKNHMCLLIFHKHKQWEFAQSSSSTWWNWQGSWWSSFDSESQERNETSLEWTGRVFDKNLRKYFHEFNLFCYIWIVYSWRRSTVTTGV